MNELMRLRRFLDQPPPPLERCEMCSAAIGQRHAHVVDLESRRLMCTCRPCYLLFTNSEAARGKFRSVGERSVRVPECDATNVVMDAADIPVGVAFFLRNSSQNRVIAFYPSPAGATESALPLDVWEEAVRAHPLLSSLEPDTEALMVRRGRESWILPVDACYELVGRIRRCWRGFDGGQQAKQEMDAFFEELRQREEAEAPWPA